MRLNLGVEGSIERRNEGDEYRELGENAMGGTYKAATTPHVTRRNRRCG